MNIKQAIQIGRHINDIFVLPCVSGISKGKEDSIIIHLYGDVKNEQVLWGDYNIAHEGDWLCEDYDGNWQVLTDRDYRQIKKTTI